MTIDLDQLEALYISRKFTLGSVPDTVLELVAELRRTRLERDWLARTLASVAHIMHPQGGYAPECNYDTEPRKCADCWLKAAQEVIEEYTNKLRKKS